MKNKNKEQNTEYGHIQYYEMPDLDDVIDAIYQVADKLDIEHPDRYKKYEHLSVLKTIEDMAKSAGTEASHLFYPKDKEKYYESRTRAGEFAKYASRYGMSGALGAGIWKVAGKIGPIANMAYKFIKRSGKDEPVKEENKKPEYNTDPLLEITRKGKSKPDVSKEKKQINYEQNDTNKNPFENNSEITQPQKSEPDINGLDKKNDRDKKIYRDMKNEMEKNEQKWNFKYNAILPDDQFNPVKISDTDIDNLANYHKSLGEVFDKNNSEMITMTLNSSEYKELERLSKYGYSPLETSELFTKADNINLKEYSKDGVSAYDTLYGNLGSTTIMGKTIKQALSDLISSDEYKNLPDYSSDMSQNSKISVIDDIFTNYTNHTRIRMINNVPDFADSSGTFLAKNAESLLTDSKAFRLEECSKRASVLAKYFV